MHQMDFLVPDMGTNLSTEPPNIPNNWSIVSERLVFSVGFGDPVDSISMDSNGTFPVNMCGVPLQFHPNSLQVSPIGHRYKFAS